MANRAKIARALVRTCEGVNGRFLLSAGFRFIRKENPAVITDILDANFALSEQLTCRRSEPGPCRQVHLTAMGQTMLGSQTGFCNPGWHQYNPFYCADQSAG